MLPALMEIYIINRCKLSSCNSRCSTDSFVVSLVSSASIIISDAIVIATTWKYTIFQSGFVSRYLNFKPSIISVVLADGDFLSVNETLLAF